MIKSKKSLKKEKEMKVYWIEDEIYTMQPLRSPNCKNDKPLIIPDNKAKWLFKVFEDVGKADEYMDKIWKEQNNKGGIK